MPKLKIILHSKKLIIISIILFLIYVIINLNIEKKSIYTKDDNNFLCTIDSYYIKDNYLKANLSCKEKLIGVYYFKDEDEINNFKNTYNYKDKVLINGILDEYKENTNINLFNQKRYYEAYNIFYKLKIKTIEKKESYNKIYFLYNYFHQRIDKLESKSYIYSLVLGNKFYIDDDILDTYKSIGIMHVFAVSGMHINVIIEIINKLYNKENNRRNRITLLIIFLYYLLVRSVSLERVFISYLITHLNKKYELGIGKLYKIILIIMIMLIINPRYLYLSSFYFTIILSSFLILYSAKLKNIIHVSMLSFLVSLPLLGYFYNEVNILSILFNIIFVPVVSTIIFPLSILTIFINVLDYPLSIIINIYESIIVLLSSLSINIILKKNILFVFLYYLILLISLYKKKIIILYLILFIIHININLLFINNYVYFFDVGQGDSILISIDNKNYMIDTGGKVGSTYLIADNTLIPVLKSLGISKLDYLILTHGDYDHMGESINLINNFNVDKIVFNCGEINDLEKELYNNKSYKCIKSLDNKLYFLQTSVYDDENENSNVIYMNINNYSFLFMGDAGYVKEKDIIDKYNIHDIDVLKVGHHGSNTSSSKEFIDIINPKYAVISVGANNKYGQPHKEVLGNLKNSIIHRTDYDGGIMFKINQ